MRRSISALGKYALTILTIIYLSLATFGTPVFATTVSPEIITQINSLPSNSNEYLLILKKLDDPHPASTFAQAVTLERSYNTFESIHLMENLAKQFPEAPYLMWRLSRLYWVYAENLDINDKENRLTNFQTGFDWAIKGITTNPQCAECYLFKFGNLGRLSTTKGLTNSISAARELSETIAKALELGPKHSDTSYNKELANAYYASSVFYRIVPDWLIIKWIAGVRGDKLISLSHIKKATEISPARIDYMVELGAIYLCLANDKQMEEMRPLGIKTLEKAISMKQIMPTDTLDKQYAAGFLKDSAGACGFSRDGIVDLDNKKFEDKQ